MRRESHNRGKIPRQGKRRKSWLDRYGPAVLSLTVIIVITGLVGYTIFSEMTKQPFESKGKIRSINATGENTWKIEVIFYDIGETFNYHGALPSYATEGAWVNARYNWEPPEMLEFLGPTEKPGFNFTWIGYLLLILAITAVMCAIYWLITKPEKRRRKR